MKLLLNWKEYLIYEAFVKLERVFDYETFNKLEKELDLVIFC